MVCWDGPSPLNALILTDRAKIREIYTPKQPVFVNSADIAKPTNVLSFVSFLCPDELRAPVQGLSSDMVSLHNRSNLGVI